jgi:hypothetical protein
MERKFSAPNLHNFWDHLEILKIDRRTWVGGDNRITGYRCFEIEFSYRLVRFSEASVSCRLFENALLP